MKSLTSGRVHFLSLTLAFASMIYELALSHYMFTLFGSMVQQYILVTGSFILFLGIGAILHEKLSEKYELTLYQVEYALSFLGLSLSAIPLTIFVWMPEFSYGIFWFLICLVALLSGFELPALLRLSPKKLSTLGFDYLGMASACLFFPFLLLPFIGLLPTIFLFSFLNFTVAIYLQKVQTGQINKIMSSIFIVLFFTLVYLQESIEELFIV